MTKQETILITGGKGFIGSHLTTLLQANGFQVFHLSRRISGLEKTKTFLWNVSEGFIDDNALTDVDHIIHLAGEGIADKRWTEKRKKEIISSRVDAAKLLIHKIGQQHANIKSFISASGSGYYGNTEDRIVDENHQAGNDFLSESCLLWEKAVSEASEKSMRTVIIRTGFVLDKNDGALPKMAMMVKMGLGSAFGKGKQFIPWIHINDLCNIYLKAVQDPGMQGPYNAAAPKPVTNYQFMKTLALVLNRPFFMPSVPSFLLKLMLGEMSAVVLSGNRLSAEKIIRSGYAFQFEELKTALEFTYSK